MRARPELLKRGRRREATGVCVPDCDPTGEVGPDCEGTLVQCSGDARGLCMQRCTGDDCNVDAFC